MSIVSADNLGDLSEYSGLAQVQGLDMDVLGKVTGIGKGILDLQVGDRCNFRCTYCFTGAGDEVRGLAAEYRSRVGREAGLLSEVDYESILTEVKGMGVNNLIISSEGESTLYQGVLLKLIARANSLGFSIVLFTNGAMIDGKLASFLRANNVSLIGKLNSLNPRNNSAISRPRRNDYSYADLNGQMVPTYIHELHGAGFDSRNLALNYVVHSGNKDELREFWHWSRLSATGLTPMGEFLESTGFVNEHSGMAISIEEIRLLRKAIQKVDDGAGFIYRALPDDSRMLDIRALINPKVLVIDSRGFVKDRAAQFTLDAVHGNIRDIALEGLLETNVSPQIALNRQVP